jgi:hypothetical protein
MSSVIHWTTFSTLRSTQPVPLDMPLETLREILTTPRVVSSKKDRRDPFSLVRYQTGSRRGNAGIESVTGAVLDFDFKEDLITLKKGRDFIETFLRERGMSSFNHVWYTTFSYTPDRPNFRVVLPFHPDKERSPQNARLAIDKIFYWLKDDPSLDPCSKTLAQVYFPPVLRKTLGEDFFFCGANIEGSYFDPDILEERPQEKECPPPVTYQTVSAEFFEQALEWISPDVPYLSWIEVGMALKAELREAGFDLWEQWSQRGSKYTHNKPGNMQKTWASFKGSGLTGGTIVKMAKENGFNPSLHQSWRRTAIANNNVLSFPSGKAVRGEETTLPLYTALLDNAEDEDDQVFFKDWDGMDEANIYDLSSWPFLDFLNRVFLTFAHPDRHPQRLAAVITVAGHLLKERFGCPNSTNFYTLAMMPTGTGKNKFLETIEGILSFFLCGSHLVRDIGTVQGLYKHLLAQGGKMFNLVDEVSELIRGLNTKGGGHKDEIKKALKEISTGNTLSTKLIKGEDLETISHIYASLFWTGTDYCFKYLEEDDFWSGMMGRFLFFHMPNFCDFGILDQETQKIIEQPVTLPGIEELWNASLTYEFGKRIHFSSEAIALNQDFLTVCRKKAEALGEKDIRTTVLVRAQEFARKIATLTCDTQGHVSIAGMQWGVAVVITSLKVASVLIQKRFYSNRSKEALNRLEACIIRECKKAGSYKIPRRILFRSLSDLPNRVIKDLLERLENNETIKQELVTNQPGRNSVLIEVVGGPLKQEIGDCEDQPSLAEKPFKQVKQRIYALWKKNKQHPITIRELSHSFQYSLSRETVCLQLQELQQQGVVRTEEITFKNKTKRVLIYWKGEKIITKGDAS